MSETLSLNSHETLEHRCRVLCHEGQLRHHVHATWPTSNDVELEAAYSSRQPALYEALVERAGALARVNVSAGFAHVNAYAGTPAGADELLEWVRQQIPRGGDASPDMVPVTFWSLGPLGPQSFRRLIDAPAFSDIEANYPGASELEALLHDWRPGMGGQLVLWHGDAGTGKTTALRALGREWREWAELHYIVDPDKFFGDSAAYMLNVMLGGELEGKLAGGEEPAPSWRLLLLEDCGELLAPDARREVGQALSRLLNACDGLIGRGLRLLILVTTNEPLEKVHPAISRPGRCAHRIEFERFAPLAARQWLERHDAWEERAFSGSVTLADLYAIRDGQRTETGRRPVGFAA